MKHKRHPVKLEAFFDPEPHVAHKQLAELQWQKRGCRSPLRLCVWNASKNQNWRREWTLKLGAT